MIESTPRATLIHYLELWAGETPGKVWLRERRDDSLAELTWAQAREQIQSVAAWLENSYASGTSVALLSRNRAHWVLADRASIAAGGVTGPVFTTLPSSTAHYILDFSEARVLFLGEAANWLAVREVLPAGITVITLPGVDIDYP
ncbi:MAG: AMP-binding protein, partial [Lysobacterales bacterium]